jgi:hypothetical protein
MLMVLGKEQAAYWFLCIFPENHHTLFQKKYFNKLPAHALPYCEAIVATEFWNVCPMSEDCMVGLGYSGNNDETGHVPNF